MTASHGPGAAWDEFALVMVDAQHDFYPESVAAAHPDLPAATTRLLATCRSRGVEVVHLNARFASDGSDWMARYRLRGRIPCVAGTAGVEPLEFARPAPGERVIDKQSFDGFLGTGLHEHLQAAGRRFLLVAGLVTSTCVLFTASSATQLGYLVAVVEDCCGDSPGGHDEVLDRYPYIFSRTTSLTLDRDRADWDEQLRGLATVAL